MGDVALMVPVIKSLVASNPDVEVTVVTRPKFAPLFYDIERVIAFPADVDYSYTGIFGMRDLFKTLLRKGPFEVVIDMHDHLRTKILRFFFKLFGHQVIVFDKGRHEKKAFIKHGHKNDKPLAHTVIRYYEAFERAGFSFSLLKSPYFEFNDSIREAASKFLEERKLVKNETWIGIAPFAAHASKIWPLDNYPALIEAILRKTKARFFLFGGGTKEVKFFESLAQKFPEQCVVVAGHLKLRQEMVLMKQLDVMVCVDSSNMHLSALSAVPVVSIWGGTHPDIGFSPYGSNKMAMVQVSREELPCRPCSVYGRSTCPVGGFPCLTRIGADQIADRVMQTIQP